MDLKSTFFSIEGNFGYITKTPSTGTDYVDLEEEEEDINDDQGKANKWLLSGLEFKMIDFLPPLTSNDYKVEKMLSTFYHGNKVTKYLAGTVMDYAVNRSNEGLKSKKVRLESLMKKLVQQAKRNSENSQLSDEWVESKLEQTNPNYSKYCNQIKKSIN